MNQFRIRFVKKRIYQSIERERERDRCLLVVAHDLLCYGFREKIKEEEIEEE